VQRITETIDGRTYHIEVSKVARDRWRAHLVRLPGIPTAMMPFYGTTPECAAQSLAEWLARVQRAAQG
jgi:IS1 family transposase